MSITKQCLQGALLGIALLILPHNAAAEGGLAVGDSLPFFTLKSLNPAPGTSAYVSLDKMIGSSAVAPKKLVLVSFFATYCEPCKKELPYLAKLHQLYEKDGFSVIVVTIDKEAEKIQEANELAQKHGVTFPVLSDRFNIVAKRYRVSKLPSVFLMDSAGRATMVESGYNEDISKKLLTQVRQGLGKPTADPIPPELHAFFPATNKVEPKVVGKAVSKKQYKKKHRKKRRKRSSKKSSK